MKYLYCDSCFLITMFQEGKLDNLSQYKEQFFVAETQIQGELMKPKELSLKVRKSITVIVNDREEIVEKTSELYKNNQTLSKYDCLCMAYSLIDGYCLITNDKALIKKCRSLSIAVKTAEDILKEFDI